MPPLYFLISLILIVVVHFAVPSDQILTSSAVPLGFLPIVVGIFLNLSAGKLFKKYRTTFNPSGKSSVLVTRGVFAFSRNPMYLGMVLILLGTAWFLGSLTPFIIPIIFVWVIRKKFIFSEEMKMEKTFGAKYTEYKKEVRRWL